MPRPLTPREAAVYEALRSRPDRVLSRAEISKILGIDGLSARRVDSLLVGVRESLGKDAIVTVRGRGWRLRGADE